MPARILPLLCNLGPFPAIHPHFHHLEEVIVRVTCLTSQQPSIRGSSAAGDAVDGVNVNNCLRRSLLTFYFF